MRGQISYPTDEFGKGLVLSLLSHATIFMFIFIRALFIPSYDKVHQSAVRVDIVDLPDKIDRSLPLSPQVEESPAKPAPKPEEPPPVTTKESPTAPLPEAKIANQEKAKEAPKTSIEAEKQLRQKQEEALRRLKAMDAVERIKKIEAAQMAQKKIKGNILSPGTALTGIHQLQHEEYISLVDQKIKANWFLPQWLIDKQLKAQVRIRIGKQGEILTKQLVQSSGNSDYDAIVLETVERSAPFPAPPEKFIEIVGVGGVLIGFPE
ncbi:MAG: cell envelope integrity protein TolA [Bdellovibrionaceae bacterium]|nr:cell envelope integrity protein TolA [Pseudobdellovibrionaceae bacterium]